jgi:hypothetical protein
MDCPEKFKKTNPANKKGRAPKGRGLFISSNKIH